MGSLGVSQVFSKERNIQIILEQQKKNPQLTAMQVNYLSRFTWVRHTKGLSYPLCKCLRCEGLNAIRERKS